MNITTTQPSFSSPVDDIATWWPRLEVDTNFFHYVEGADPSFPSIPIIFQFDGSEYAFLSNFFPFPIKCWDIDFPTTEHAYQWAKCGGGLEWGEKIRLAETPGIAKKLGQRCPIRSDWDKDGVKFQVMKEVLIAKFRGTSLWPKLNATGDAYLVEGNVWHDNSFGICIKKNCERDCGAKRGNNNLGRLLMELRAILRGDLKLSLDKPSTDKPFAKHWVRPY